MFLYNWALTVASEPLIASKTIVPRPSVENSTILGSKRISEASNLSRPSYLRLSYLDESTIRQLVVLLIEDSLVSDLSVERNVVADETKLFLDLFDGFEVG